MAVTGRTGADAIFKALKRICIVLSHYSGKLKALIAAMLALELITTEEAAAANAFVDGSIALCAIFDKLAAYSGFTV